MFSCYVAKVSTILQTRNGVFVKEDGQFYDNNHTQIRFTWITSVFDIFEIRFVGQYYRIQALNRFSFLTLSASRLRWSFLLPSPYRPDTPSSPGAERRLYSFSPTVIPSLPSFTVTYWKSNVIVPKVKDEGKVKKNSLYIRIIVRGKGPDVLFSSGQFVHMPDGKTSLRFGQDTFTFQAKHFGVSGKTLRCLLSNAKAFHPKRLGIPGTSGTTFPGTVQSLFLNAEACATARRSLWRRMPKHFSRHSE